MKNIRIGGLSIKYFLPAFVILMTAVCTGALNKDLVGTIAFLVICGEGLFFIGGKIPFVGKWLGGAVLLPMLCGSALSFFNLIPDTLYDQVSTFVYSGFINLILCSVIAGSILSIDREMLKKASVKLLPMILGVQFFIILFAFLGCLITGTDLFQGMYMTGIPNFCGGSSSALAAIPSIYTELLGGDMQDYMGRFMLLLNISNLLCIMSAGLLNQIGKRCPSLTGNGKLSIEPEDSTTKNTPENKPKGNITGGCILAVSILLCGTLMSKVIPQLNYVAWTAIIAIVLKLLNVFDDEAAASAQIWQVNLTKTFIPALMFGASIVSVDLSNFSAIFTWQAMIIILMSLLGALIGSLLFARLFHFYPIDAMIAVGCNCGTIGGSGAVAVLSTAERMDLMPYATLTGRLGGAIMLVLLSTSAPFFIK